MCWEKSPDTGRGPLNETQFPMKETERGRQRRPSISPLFPLPPLDLMDRRGTWRRRRARCAPRRGFEPFESPGARAKGSKERRDEALRRHFISTEMADPKRTRACTFRGITRPSSPQHRLDSVKSIVIPELGPTLLGFSPVRARATYASRVV